MDEERWFVAIDGKQLEGARSADEVRGLIESNAGKKVLVWNEKMTGWADAATVPQLRPAAPASPPRGADVAGAVASAVASTVPEARDTVRREAHFLRGLLDLSFSEFVTPKIVRILYIVSMFFVALMFLAMVLGALGMIVGGARYGFGGPLIGILYLALAPIVAIVQLTVSRVFLEVVLVLFAIKDNLERKA
jgi:hypothetical protein